MMVYLISIVLIINNLIALTNVHSIVFYYFYIHCQLLVFFFSSYFSLPWVVDKNNTNMWCFGLEIFLGMLPMLYSSEIQLPSDVWYYIQNPIT